jgi:hypothetical protein
MAGVLADDEGSARRGAYTREETRLKLQRAIAAITHEFDEEEVLGAIERALADKRRTARAPTGEARGIPSRRSPACCATRG